MPLWKRFLLELYYQATRPVRAWNYWQEVSQDHLPIIVLYYHRIADDRANPWTLSNRMFMRQIAWLRDRFDLISLHDAQQRIRHGYNPRPCISLTFDDGYADNCRQAIPWLVKQRIPCTYFVTLQNILKDEPFSHDLVRGHRFSPNTVEQLQAMAAAGIEIGAHAYTHIDLSTVVDPRLLRYEVVDAKQELEAALDRPVRYFAFPFGMCANLSPAAFALAKQAGYLGVCSAYGGYNFPGDDPFHLQRIPVDDTMVRLKNWVTMDPRKLHIPRYVYEESGARGQGAEDTGQGTELKGIKKLVKRK
jgi:peptidoglycan/xylan/chitin deacetylase (PgdA/CDA1 family)